MAALMNNNNSRVPTIFSFYKFHLPPVTSWWIFPFCTIPFLLYITKILVYSLTKGSALFEEALYLQKAHTHTLLFFAQGEDF